LDVDFVVQETAGGLGLWKVWTAIGFREEAGMLWTIRFGCW
jgi:hypothetical protein